MFLLMDLAVGRCPRAVWLDSSVALRALAYIPIYRCTSSSGINSRSLVLVVLLAIVTTCATHKTTHYALYVEGAQYNT